MLAGVGWACGSPTAESGPPPSDEPGINIIVEGANGIYAPGSCDGPLDELSLVGHLDLPGHAAEGDTGFVYDLSDPENPDVNRGLYVLRLR